MNKSMLSLIKKLNIENITFDLYIIYFLKYLHQKIFLITRPNQQILFIIGCQRSGTSMISRVFARDFNVSVYRESSRLSSEDQTHVGKYKLRLNSSSELESAFSKNKAPIIVCKPLVETQNITELFHHFPNSKALWMYRHYKDATNSLINKFSTNVGIRNLRGIVENNQDHWYSEKVPDSVRLTIEKHFSEQMKPQDAAALFWYVRNQLFYELNLENNTRVLMCRYEDLASQPFLVMQQIYYFLGRTFNKNHAWEVNPSSVLKGQSIELSSEIQQLCDDLLKRLNTTYLEQLRQYKGDANSLFEPTTLLISDLIQHD